MVNVYQVSPKKSNNLFSRLSLNTILIILNVVAFIVFTIIVSTNLVSIDSIALNPSDIFQGRHLWTLLTSMFMHSSFFHLFANMLSLFFVGALVERIIGRKRYLWFYLFSGIFAGLVYASLAYFFGGSIIGSKLFGGPETLAVGASGAIFGLAGLLALLIPKKKVYLIAGPLFAIILQSILHVAIPSSGINNILDVFITIYIFIAIFSMLSFNSSMRKIGVPIEMPFWLLPVVAIIPLVIIGLFVELPIGNSAHFGGLVFGLIYGLILKTRYKNKTKYIREYFS